jgi:hypothetical protein
VGGADEASVLVGAAMAVAAGLVFAGNSWRLHPIATSALTQTTRQQARKARQLMMHAPLTLAAETRRLLRPGFEDDSNFLGRHPAIQHVVLKFGRNFRFPNPVPVIRDHDDKPDKEPTGYRDDRNQLSAIKSG